MLDLVQFFLLKVIRINHNSQISQQSAQDENLVTALVPSTTACLASSPGRRSLTAVWTSLDERVCLLLYLTSLPASAEILSKRSPMKEFMMLMDLLEIPVSG